MKLFFIKSYSYLHTLAAIIVVTGAVGVFVYLTSKAIDKIKIDLEKDSWN